MEDFNEQEKAAIVKKSDRLVVKSNLGSYSDGLNISKGFRDKVESVVVGLIDASISRAKANGRRTLMDYDL